MTYQDIINKNKLPIDLDKQIKIIKVNNCEKDIILDMTIEDFIKWANFQGVSEFFSHIDLYDYTEVAITSSDIKILKDILYYIILDTNNIEYGHMIIDKFIKDLVEKNNELILETYKRVNKQIVEKEQYNYNVEDYIDLSVFNNLDEEENNEEEINIDDIKLNTVANNIIDNIIQFNKNIPEEIFYIPKFLSLSCIINGKIYGVVITNDLDFKPIIFEALMTIIQKYQSNIKNGLNIIERQAELQEQLRLEEEAKIEQNHKDFLKFMMSNVEYTKQTVPLKLIYIDNMWQGKYGQDQKDLIRLAYPKYSEELRKNQKEQIVNEIKMGIS